MGLRLVSDLAVCVPLVTRVCRSFAAPARPTVGHAEGTAGENDLIAGGGDGHRWGDGWGCPRWPRASLASATGTRQGKMPEMPDPKKRDFTA